MFVSFAAGVEIRELAEGGQQRAIGFLNGQFFHRLHETPRRLAIEMIKAIIRQLERLRPRLSLAVRLADAGGQQPNLPDACCEFLTRTQRLMAHHGSNVEAPRRTASRECSGLFRTRQANRRWERRLPPGETEFWLTETRRQDAG